MAVGRHQPVTGKHKFFCSVSLSFAFVFFWGGGIRQGMVVVEGGGVQRASNVNNSLVGAHTEVDENETRTWCVCVGVCVCVSVRAAAERRTERERCGEKRSSLARRGVRAGLAERRARRRAT